MTRSAVNWELKLLGFWQLRLNAQPVDVGWRQQRVIAALAVLGPQPRPLLAGTLWPDTTETRADGNLRSALFHIRHDLSGLVTEYSHALALDERVDVDLTRLRRTLDELKRPEAANDAAGAVESLRAELLPGWYEDWVLSEQDRLRDERIAALESLAQEHLCQRNLPAALAAARAAITLDPLRENARALLVRTFLADGDHGNAVKADRAYRAELAAALGTHPSPRFNSLLAPPSPSGLARSGAPSPPVGRPRRSAPTSVTR